MKMTSKTLYWIPRILCILAILFVSLFALDAFGHEKSFWEQIRDFFIHLIPSFILLMFLLAAWKWELWGGIIFLAIGIGFTPWIASHNYAMNNSIGMTICIIASITLPFMVVGALFIASHFINKQKTP